MGEGREEGKEGSKQETTERASSQCSENTSRLRSRWVAVCVEMKQGVGGRVKNKHTLFCLSSTHFAFPTLQPTSLLGYGVAGGGRKTVRQPPTPKYKQLSVNQSCLSRLSPVLAREGNLAPSLTWDLRREGVEDPSNRPGCGVSPGTGKTVSTSQHPGDI